LGQILFQIGGTFTETFQMLQQAYGEDCLSRTQCHEWYQRFKSGRTSIEDDSKSGRPSTSMDDDHFEKVLAVIRQNRRLTVREVAEKAGICKTSCHLILTEKAEDASYCRKMCVASVDASLFIYEFLTKRETTVVSPAALLSRFVPVRTFPCSRSRYPH